MYRPVLLAVLPLLSTGCFVYSGELVEEDFERLVFEEPIDTIVFDVPAGGLEIFPSDGESLVVERTIRYRRQAPEITTQVDGTTLRIDVECPRALGTCVVSHQIAIPAAVEVRGATGSGGLSITGARDLVDVTTGSGGIYLCNLDGDTIAHTGSGAIELNAVRGDLDLETGSGAIFGDHVWAYDALVYTGSGAVDLHFDAPPEDLDVHTGSGGVELFVPRGAYDTDLHTGSGSIDVWDITEDRSADARITVDTGSGGILIQGVDP